MESYQISVVVLTYNPQPKKLQATLLSILLQKNISYQIVIADDGSANPGFDAAQALFEQYGFTDYVFVANRENRGTVYNMTSALEKSEGTFIKPISPGDLLSGETVLQEWYDAVSTGNAALSFCDAVYYQLVDGVPQAVVADAHPQDIRCYIKNAPDRARYRYVVLNDLFLGAAVLCRREVMLDYMQQICGKAIYAEDHAYRIMAFDRVGFHYFQQTGIVYESGTGISTSGNTIWMERLYRDADACSQIILQRPWVPQDKTAAHFHYLQEQAGISPVDKVIKFLRVPGLLERKLRPLLRKRKTADALPEAFLSKLFFPDKSSE